MILLPFVLEILSLKSIMLSGSSFRNTYLSATKMLNMFVCSQLMELEIIPGKLLGFIILRMRLSTYDRICFKHIGVRTSVYKRCFTYRDYQILNSKIVYTYTSIALFQLITYPDRTNVSMCSM